MARRIVHLDTLRVTPLGSTAEILELLGKTEFKGVPTYTAVAIGPAYSKDIDLITGPQGLVPVKLA